MALLYLGDGSLSGCPGAGHKDGPVTHEGKHLGGDPPKAPPPPVTSTVLITIAPGGRCVRGAAVHWAGSARGTDGFGELAVVQGVVQAAAREQFRVVAVFHDASAVHDDDRVGVSDRG
jgi:hypothetical protein